MRREAGWLTLVLGLGLALPGGARGASPDTEVVTLQGRPVSPAHTGTLDIERAAVMERLSAEPLRREPPRKARRAPRFLPEMPMPEGWSPQALPDAGPPPAQADAPLAPPPAVQFPALGDSNTAIPPDTHGAVSPTRVMTTLNSQVLVQDRAGATVSGPLALGSFWTGIATEGPFDPRVLYDPDPAYGGRWIWVAVQAGIHPASGLLVAASSGPAPTVGPGALFDADPTDQVWADYPSVGFNKNWVVVQVNMFSTTTPYPFVRSEVYVFEKAALYAGTPAPTVFPLEALGGTHVPAVVLDPAEEDLYLVQRWNSGAGALRLYKVSGAPAAPTLSVLGFVVGSPWADSEPTGTGADFAPQGPSCGGARIQTNDSRIQNVVHRNGRLWAAHTVFLPSSTPDRASVQWWQIETDGTVVQRGLVDDPTAARFHAFPSIAVNRNDDTLLGFSSFSAAEPASARYAYRIATDPAGTMQVPVVLKPGEDCYYKDFGSGLNRWGDYSATVVDPVDDTRMWTIQEYAATSVGTGPFDDRWGTWWGMLDPVPALSIADASVLEGDAGTTSLVFDLALSIATSQEVTVQWSTADGTARVDDADYLAASGTVTFAPGETAATITVSVRGDLKREADETFVVDLASPVNATLPDPQAVGTIFNDDPDPQISIGDRRAVEGNTGTSPATPFELAVTLSHPSAFPVSVSWATVAGGTATPGTDYVSASGMVSFPAGDAAPRTVVVQVVGDTDPEPDETFHVDLSAPSGGTLLKARGIGVILDDDEPLPPVRALSVVSDGTTSPSSGRNRLQWVNPVGAGTPVNVRIRWNEGPGCTPPDPGNPAVTSGFVEDLPCGGACPDQRQYTSLTLDRRYCHTVYVEYAPGGLWSEGTSAPGVPFDATGPVKWKHFTGSGATAVSPPTVGQGRILVPSNDTLLHAMANGAAGGPWPPGWTPARLGSPAQARSPIVPLFGFQNVYLATQDGWVHALDAETGATIWATLIGTGAQAAPAGIFTAFGGEWSYLLVGTRQATNNQFHALDPFTGAVVDSYPKVGDPEFGQMGDVNGMATVDYARGRVYFGTLGGSSTGSLWCLKLGPPTTALGFGWAAPRAVVGDFEGSPVVRGNRVLAGNTAGVLWAVDPEDGTPLYSYASGDEAVKGFPFPDRRNGDVYFTTENTGGDGRVHAVTDTGSAFTTKWVSGLLQKPSVPLLWTGGDRLYVGVERAVAGGGLLELPIGSGTPVLARDLEPADVVIGAPSLDIGVVPNQVHAGSVAGVVYAVQAPF
jgi:outer membrane protein assembly factor BamB